MTDTLSVINKDKDSSSTGSVKAKATSKSFNQHSFFCVHVLLVQVVKIKKSLDSEKKGRSNCQFSMKIILYKVKVK